MARTKHEEEAGVKVEVTACLAWLTREIQTKFDVKQEKENADRMAAEVLVELEHAKAAYARAEVETVLRLAIESLERGAAISAADAARKDAERMVQEQARTVAAEASARLREEASAREEAERKAEEAERKAEEAEERAKATYARAEVETVLRLAIESIERDAVISAADAARRDAERKVQEQAKTVAAEASARLREEASAREEAERKAEEAEERAKAIYARAEVETVLRLAIESLERDAVISAADAARKDTERKVQEQARTVAAEASARLREEASARGEAERKAEEAERKAEEALRKVALAKARMKEKEDALNAAFAKAEQREAEIRKEAQEARESQERKTASLGVDEARREFWWGGEGAASGLGMSSQRCAAAVKYCPRVALLLFFVCGHHIAQSIDQPGKVANPARGQLNREMNIFCPRSRLRIWSLERGSAVPSRVSLLILHTQAEYGAYSQDSSRFPRRHPFI